MTPYDDIDLVNIGFKVMAWCHQAITWTNVD